MIKDITISVIMPVYNAQKTLKKSVSTVLHQTYSDFELILVDDGSTDLSGEMCDEIQTTDKRVRVIHQKNSGVSHARNTGIELSKGQYIMFFDSDDEMDSNLMEDNIKLINEFNPDVLIFNFRYAFSDHFINNAYSLDEVFVGDGDKFFKEELETAVEKELINAPWNKIIRRDLVLKNKLLFDERFSILEDAIFSISVCMKAKKICINSNIYHSYNVWETGSLRTKWSDTRFMAMKELFKLEKKYCNNFEDNKHQLWFFGTIFGNSIYAYMQLVSTCSELGFKNKRERIKEVCNDNSVRHVFFNNQFKHKLGTNKKIIRFLVKMKMVGLIIIMYQLKNKIR